LVPTFVTVKVWVAGVADSNGPSIVPNDTGLVLGETKWNDLDRIDGFDPFVGGFLVEYAP
jgi:hypothetical protein